MGRREPPKASEVFAKAQFAFWSKKLSFAEAFPQIDEVRVEITQSGEGVYEDSKKITYTRDTLPGEYEDCSNPDCWGGGVSIGQILQEMVHKGDAEAEESKRCKGHEGSTHRRGRMCFNFFKVKIKVTYKSKHE